MRAESKFVLPNKQKAAETQRKSHQSLDPMTNDDVTKKIVDQLNRNEKNQESHVMSGKREENPEVMSFGLQK